MDDLTIESYRKPDLDFIHEMRLEPMMKNEKAVVRGIPDKLLPYDSFLAYLEWKLNGKI